VYWVIKQETQFMKWTLNVKSISFPYFLFILQFYTAVITLPYHAWDAVRPAGAATLIPFYLKNHMSSGELISDSECKSNMLV